GGGAGERARRGARAPARRAARPGARRLARRRAQAPTGAGPAARGPLAAAADPRHRHRLTREGAAELPLDRPFGFPLRWRGALGRRARLHERPQPLALLGAAQLGERPRLELAHPLARQTELGADLLERVLLLAAHAEAPAQDVLLARRQLRDAVRRLALEAHVVQPLERRRRVRILHVVLHLLGVGATHLRLQAHRLAGHALELLDLVGRRLERLGQVGGRRLAAEPGLQLRVRAVVLEQRVVHVARDADRARVVLDRPDERLADPPHGVGRELVPAVVVELLDRTDQAEVPLLD